MTADQDARYVAPPGAGPFAARGVFQAADKWDFDCQKRLVCARVSWIVFLALVFFVLLGGSPAAAQIVTGSLHGQVTDQSGGAVPNAPISVTDARGQTTIARANQSGVFDLKDMAPGSYKVDVSVPGFAAYKKDAVQVAAGETQQLNISLALEQQEQQVTVTGDVPILDVTPSNNASAVVISGKELEALPDDPDELQADLQALGGPSAGPNGGQMYIDGFTAGQLPPKSSIREIRLNQNPFSAQYDKVGLGRIEILTKPGTDQWHGQASVNGNASGLNSKNPFAVTKGSYESTQFNGNIAGPVSKKASIFTNADYRNIHDLSIVDAVVLDPNVPCVAAVPCSGTHFNASVAFPRTRVNIGPRLDYQLGKNNTLSVRYQYFRNEQKNDGIGGDTGVALPSQGYNTLTREQTVQISDTQILSAKVINETRLQLLRNVSRQTALNPGLPSVIVTGSFLGGGSNEGNVFGNTNRYELQNYTSVSSGKHFVKFGARLREVTDRFDSTTGFNGSFIFPSLYAYQSGQANQFVVSTGSPISSTRLFDGGLYAEDDWRIRPNVTLSYGLRFETQNHISDHADWAPRIGIAWGLGGGKTPKTVVRAGYGIFYDRFTDNLILQATRLNGTIQQQYVVTNPICPTSAVVTNCSFSELEGLITSVSTIYRIAPNLHAPEMMQIGASLERQISKLANVSISYINSRGNHQLLTNNINTPLPGQYNPANPQANRPLGPENIFEYQSTGIYRQNQLSVNVNIRAGARLTLNGYYSLNYANSDTAGATSSPSNPYNLLEDYGRAAFDIRNRYFLGGTMALPWGLQLSPFIVANSGSPYNVTLSQDLIGSAILNQRPGLISSAACAKQTITGSVYCTPAGTFDSVPTSGETLVPVNYLTGPGHFTLNVRLSKTFGFGQGAEARAGRTRGQGIGGGARGDSGGGAIAAPKRYSVTLSANARNVFNNVNLGTPIGNLGSRLFGESHALAGGSFSSGAANRQVYLQLLFAF
jgi:Carboxypeptidase regulatory-like domain/TonB dependent receptor